MSEFIIFSLRVFWCIFESELVMWKWIFYPPSQKIKSELPNDGRGVGGSDFLNNRYLANGHFPP